MKNKLLVLALLLATLSVCAQQSQQIWGNIDYHTYLPTGSANTAEAYSMAMDAFNNSYVVYKLGGTGELGLVKIDADGIQKWEHLATVSNYAPNAIALDANGNIFVAGYEYTATSNPFGVGIWLRKYDANGNFIWEQYRNKSMGPVQRFYTSNTTKPTVMMKLDGAGNPYVVSREYNASYGPPVFTRFFIEKYNNSGTSLWAKASDQIRDNPYAIDLTFSGTLAVTGGNDFYAYTTVYNTNGDLIWEHLNEDVRLGSDIKLLSGNQVRVLVGAFNGTNLDFGVANYSNTGTLLATATYDAGSADIAVNLEVDAQGNNIISGNSTQVSGLPYVDWVILKGTPSGNVLWQDRYNENPDNDEMVSQWDGALQLDTNGDVYASGYGGPTGVSGNLVVNSAVVVKYSGSSGTRLSVRVDQQGPLSMSTAMSVFPKGNDFFVLGFAKRKVARYSSLAVSTNEIQLEAFLRGAKVPTPAFLQVMRTDLNGNLPLSQPYQGVPWNYSGTETVNGVMPPWAVDWVLIEARTGTEASTVVQRKAGLLHAQGVITDTRGRLLQFDQLPANASIYFVVYHRNHLSMMTIAPITPNLMSTYTYDFTNPLASFGGINGGIGITSNLWGMVPGDANGDGDVNALDLNQWWQIQNGSSGYLEADLNLDGTVDLSDKQQFWQPYNGRITAVPQ